MGNMRFIIKPMHVLKGFALGSLKYK